MSRLNTEATMIWQRWTTRRIAQRTSMLLAIGRSGGFLSDEGQPMPGVRDLGVALHKLGKGRLDVMNQALETVRRELGQQPAKELCFAWRLIGIEAETHHRGTAWRCWDDHEIQERTRRVREARLRSEDATQTSKQRMREALLSLALISDSTWKAWVRQRWTIQVVCEGSADQMLEIAEQQLRRHEKQYWFHHFTVQTMEGGPRNGQIGDLPVRQKIEGSNLSGFNYSTTTLLFRRTGAGAFVCYDWSHSRYEGP